MGSNGLTANHGMLAGKEISSKGVKTAFGGLNYAVGLYNMANIQRSFENGEITRSQRNGLQLNNAVGTFAPPQIGIGAQYGSVIGRENAEELENFSVWFTKRIIFPLIGEGEGEDK